MRAPTPSSLTHHLVAAHHLRALAGPLDRPRQAAHFQIPWRSLNRAVRAKTSCTVLSPTIPSAPTPSLQLSISQAPLLRHQWAASLPELQSHPRTSPACQAVMHQQPHQSQAKRDQPRRTRSPCLPGLASRALGLHRTKWRAAGGCTL